MQVAEGVYQLQIPMPSFRSGGGLPSTLVYLVRSATGGWLVIDAGWDTEEGFRAFREGLVEAGLAPRDIVLILITHGHPDHSGMANRLKELTGAPLAMHRLDADRGAPGRMRGPAGDRAARRLLLSYGVPSQEARDGLWGHGPRLRQGPPQGRPLAQPPKVNHLLEGGEEIIAQGSGLHVYWTPGHSHGHICVYDGPRRLLFSGDHILPTISPHVSLSLGEEGDPLGRYLASLKGLVGLDVAMVHPAHEYSFPHFHRRLDEILAHHRSRLDEMLAQVEQGPRSPYQIAAGVTWNVAPWGRLHAGTRRMALFETMAHLHHMTEEGEMVAVVRDGQLLYGRPPAAPASASQ